MIVAGTSVYPRAIDFKKFREIADVVDAKAVAFHEALQPEFKDYISQVRKNASVMAEILTQSKFRVVSSGTDTQLFLLDASAYGLNGDQLQRSLDKVGITVNKNAIH